MEQHPFNGPLSGTTQVSRYQKGKTDLDFTEARDSEWQGNPLGHMQVCTSLQADNHARDAEILHVVQNSKMGYLTLTTPLSGKIFFSAGWYVLW